MVRTKASPPNVSCPTCAKLSAYDPANAFRPFCSERCKTVDLGAWASEQYRIAAEADPDPGEELEPPPPA